MKKARLLTLLTLTLILILTLTVLMGCNKKEIKVASISLKDHDPEVAIEMTVGNFERSEYTLVVNYESGAVEEIELTEEMINEKDIFLFYQIGDHDITISYGGQSYTFKVSVKRDSFRDLAFPENTVFTYDGEAHVVEVDGDIPANAVVSYPGGNTFVNAGTYEVVAIVSCDGYVTERLSTTVTVERARYDMSTVSFFGKEVVYDGSAHSLAISGVLPEGVSSPTYTINDKVTQSATDVGEYTVKANFASNDPNYEPIPEMQATLRILPAEYTVNGVGVVFKDAEGKPIEDAVKVYDGKTVTFDLDDYGKLSKKVSVSYSVLDKDGNVISSSNKNTGIINAGIYTVKVDFTLSDGHNYMPIEPIVSTFEVLRAEHPPIENIRFESAQATYNGNGHTVTILGELPEGVSVRYEYYQGNVLLVDEDGTPVESVSDVGIYTVKAVFTHENGNLGDIPSMAATLNIKKAELSLSTVGFIGASSVTYSGQPYEPKFTTWQESTGSDHDILKYGPVKYYVLDKDSGEYVEMQADALPTEVGSYRVSVDVSVADEYKSRYTLSGNEETRTISKQFEIIEAAA